MKKSLIMLLGAMLLLSSCGTYTGAGAFTGASFGSIIGSAIGGIAGGPRGSDIGTLVGMAGGAAVGAAVGSAADRAQQSQYDPREYNVSRGGDDRLYDFNEDFSSRVTDVAPANDFAVEIRNPRIVDVSRDGVLSRGEEARVVFELINTSSKPIFRVQPMVREITSNRHIRISENVLVESIMPGRGIRYTAVVKADDRLKDGEAIFRIGVLIGNKEMVSQTREFSVRTSKY